MKLNRLSNKLLNLMYKEYKKSEKTQFVFETFKKHFSNESTDKINRALYLLKHDNLIHIESFDNIAYYSFLTSKGISFCENKFSPKKIATAIIETIKIFK